MSNLREALIDLIHSRNIEENSKKIIKYATETKSEVKIKEESKANAADNRVQLQQQRREESKATRYTRTIEDEINELNLKHKELKNNQKYMYEDILLLKSRIKELQNKECTQFEEEELTEIKEFMKKKEEDIVKNTSLIDIFKAKFNLWKEDKEEKEKEDLKTFKKRVLDVTTNYFKSRNVDDDTKGLVLAMLGPIALLFPLLLMVGVKGFKFLMWMIGAKKIWKGLLELLKMTGAMDALKWLIGKGVKYFEDLLEILTGKKILDTLGDVDNDSRRPEKPKKPEKSSSNWDKLKKGSKSVASKAWMVARVSAVALGSQMFTSGELPDIQQLNLKATRGLLEKEEANEVISKYINEKYGDELTNKEIQTIIQKEVSLIMEKNTLAPKYRKDTSKYKDQWDAQTNSSIIDYERGELKSKLNNKSNAPKENISKVSNIQQDKLEIKSQTQETKQEQTEQIENIDNKIRPLKPQIEMKKSENVSQGLTISDVEQIVSRMIRSIVPQEQMQMQMQPQIVPMSATNAKTNIPQIGIESFN